VNEQEWYGLLCKRMSWPFTPWVVAGLKRWARMESAEETNGQTRLFNRCWNPFATTYMGEDAPRSSEDLGYGPGKWNAANNGQGVGIYASPEAGVAATASTISITWAYPAIRDTFRTQRVISQQDLEANFTTWIGSTAYARTLTEYLALLTESREPFAAPVPAPSVEARLAALEAWQFALNNALVAERFALMRLALLPDIDAVQRATKLLRGAGLLQEG
jgi:hypothetical protein